MNADHHEGNPDMQTTTPNTTGRWIDTAEVAKLIRKRLKTDFPATKFSVRISRYAGGSSIDIKWTDGPRADEVDAVAGQYEAARFDGMVDYGWTVSHWLLPDGTAVVAEDRGSQVTGGGHGELIASPPHPDAELVRFGSSYIHTRRTVSDETIDRFAVQHGDKVRRLAGIGVEYCRGCGTHLTGEAYMVETPSPHGDYTNQRTVCSLRCGGAVFAKEGVA